MLNLNFDAMNFNSVNNQVMKDFLFGILVRKELMQNEIELKRTEMESIKTSVDYWYRENQKKDEEIKNLKERLKNVGLKEGPIEEGRGNDHNE